MPHPVRTIVVHGAQLDEVVAVYIAKRYGKQEFPGIDLAGIEFVPANFQPPNGLSADDWLRHGVLHLGVGGGQFDHRPGPGQERRTGQSASLLIADYLRVSRRGELRLLIDYTTKQENEGDRDLLKLGRLVASLCEEHEDAPQFAMDIALCVVDAHVGSQRRFREARKALDEGRQVDLGELNGKPCHLVAVKSGNRKVKSLAFSAQGGYKTAVVQQSPSGHVTIFLNKFSKLDLTPVAMSIRAKELAARNSQDEVSSEDLSAEFCASVPEWFFHSNAGWLLNQEKAGVPATAIPFDEIVDAVAMALKEQISQPLPEKPSEPDHAPDIE